MPAIITHDTFGREIFHELFELIGNSRDETDAFLLGNQGPDPLFYAITDPRYLNLNHLGSVMHRQKPSEVITAFKDAISILDEPDRKIGRAYALGFLCHYELDSREHAFIYTQEYDICDAGEPRLTRANAHDVHACIETELDELVLTVKRDLTIGTFKPASEILRASNHVLDVISQMYVYVLNTVYNRTILGHGFRGSVKAYRHLQHLFYSPRNIKRSIIGYTEMLIRPYSFLRAMSHVNQKITVSSFDNHDNLPWKNTFTGEVSTASFWDLYNEAKLGALTDLPTFDTPRFNVEAAQKITQGINFNGDPTCASIISTENVEHAAKHAAAQTAPAS